MENAKAIMPLVEKEHAGNPTLDLIYRERDVFPKISHWLFGGDGWAYDIVLLKCFKRTLMYQGFWRT